MTDKTAKKPKTEKKVVDWDAMEPHYRASVRSLEDLGKEYGCSGPAILKHAKKYGWVRDLAKRIAAKAEAKVNAEAVSEEVKAQKAINQEQVVEANAELQYRIRIEHRQDIKRARALFGKLLGEIEEATNRPDLLEELFDLLHDRSSETASADDPKAVAREEERLFKLRQKFEAVISMPGRVDAAKKLSEMLERLIKLEREAFGIKNEEDERNTIDDLLLKIKREREAKS